MDTSSSTAFHLKIRQHQRQPAHAEIHRSTAPTPACQLLSASAAPPDCVEETAAGVIRACRPDDFETMAAASAEAGCARSIPTSHPPLGRREITEADPRPRPSLGRPSLVLVRLLARCFRISSRPSWESQQPSRAGAGASRSAPVPASLRARPPIGAEIDPKLKRILPGNGERQRTGSSPPETLVQPQSWL